MGARSQLGAGSSGIVDGKGPPQAAVGPRVYALGFVFWVVVYTLLFLLADHDSFGRALGRGIAFAVVMVVLIACFTWFNKVRRGGSGD